MFVKCNVRKVSENTDVAGTVEDPSKAFTLPYLPSQAVTRLECLNLRDIGWLWKWKFLLRCLIFLLLLKSAYMIIVENQQESDLLFPRSN